MLLCIEPPDSTQRQGVDPNIKYTCLCLEARGHASLSLSLSLSLALSLALSLSVSLFLSLVSFVSFERKGHRARRLLHSLIRERERVKERDREREKQSCGDLRIKCVNFPLLNNASGLQQPVTGRDGRAGS